ncbi:hypothetical protein F2P79_007134 [Pimephales promelas]|nr:hypothetical protein F2P79_007134 [Pimephales promelas]KAG1959395.1 hypothetical protein F2P79_007134 [Pimephales promelas]
MSCKTFSKRRYKPAAEFDDATLARKREYWRSKKREQRARKSSSKKKIRNENLVLCMSSVSDEPSLQIYKVDNDPTLHNHELGDPRNSSSSGLSESECYATMVPCQKEKWFQKTKLIHVLPNFPEASTNSQKGVMGNTNTDAKTVESLCPIGYSGSTICMEFHPNSIHTQKTKTEKLLYLNGKQFARSPQSHLPIVLPVHNNQNKPQNCLRPLTSAECMVRKEQSCVSKRRTCAFASKHNTRVAMTEEEIAAKRRENWRIKKREQRAKCAAKLARDRERSLGQGQSSCIVNVSSPANSKAFRGINLNSLNLKCLNQQSFGAKFFGSRTQPHVQDTKPNHTASSSSTTQALNKSKVPHFVHTQKRRNSFFGASKVESPEDRHARQKEYWRIKKREQRARLSTAVKARLKEQGTLKHHGRRCHNSINQMCGAQVSRAGAADGSHALSPVAQCRNTQTFSDDGADPKQSYLSQALQNQKLVESPEDRHARQKEYWRIKKREQRARLSTAMKARLKEQGTLKHHGRRCHNSVNQMCGAQVSRAGAADGSHALSPVAQCRNTQTFSDDGADPKQSYLSQALQNQKLVESPEDRHARQKEYWRIKKREQRARLSTGVKARLKEQGTLKHRGRRCHNSINQMRGAQVSRAGPFASSSDTIGGFIQEDGTVKVSNLKTRSEASLPASHDFSNAKCIGKVKLQVQTPWKKTPSTTLLLATSQDTSTCRQIPIQKTRRRCTISTGPQPTDKSRTHRSQIVVTPNPQNDPQEVIRRRRMQWRIKKQEQRARKAANVRKLRTAKLPPQGQASGQNATSFGSAVVQSITSEDQLGYLAEPCQTALKEEASVAPNHAMEGPLSQAEWRNIYLMDSDPVNPLLVCMVCGEQQYSLSVDGAKTHIEEVHPNTLSLGELERQGILDAWDKQVAVREHFITHQLQQRCRGPTAALKLSFGLFGTQ